MSVLTEPQPLVPEGIELSIVPRFGGHDGALLELKRTRDVVVLPKNQVDCFLVQDAYQWLLREIREYETRDDEPYAPKHCRQGVFQGVPRFPL